VRELVGTESLLFIGIGLGLIYGVLLQKGDFCFVSAFRDWFAFKHNRVLQGIIFAVLVILFGWSLILAVDLAPLDRLWLPPVGGSAIIGGIVFGAGMYVAGACASGTLYRCGMGYAYFWLVFLGMKVGYLIYAVLHEPFFVPYYFEPLAISGPVTLYEYIPPAAVAAFALLLLIYLLFRLIVKKTGKSEASGDSALGQGGRKESSANPLRWKSWDARFVGILVGLTVTLQFFLWSIWGITGPGTRIAGVAWSQVAEEAAVLDNPYMGDMFAAYPGAVLGPSEWLIIFIIIGAGIASLLSGTWRYRKPRLNRVPNAVLGGAVMGIGSRMAPGCNIGNIISGLPALSVHSLLASTGIALGVYLGYVVAQRNLQRQMKRLEQEADLKQADKQASS